MLYREIHLEEDILMQRNQCPLGRFLWHGTSTKMHNLEYMHVLTKFYYVVYWSILRL